MYYYIEGEDYAENFSSILEPFIVTGNLVLEFNEVTQNWDILSWSTHAKEVLTRHGILKKSRG